MLKCQGLRDEVSGFEGFEFGVSLIVAQHPKCSGSKRSLLFTSSQRFVMTASHALLCTKKKTQKHDVFELPKHRVWTN